MITRPSAPATERNRQPILEVLQYELRDRKNVLEIGSGTGQHAVYFAAAMPHLNWQTSDLPGNHPGIKAWIDWAGLDNVAMPVGIDVSACERSFGPYDAVFSANTAHIMSFPTVKKMFDVVGEALVSNGIFCLYGPFKRNGEFSSESNAQFDRSLKIQDERMGIRDLQELSSLADAVGLSPPLLYAMPANNMLVVWRKAGSTA